MGTAIFGPCDNHDNCGAQSQCRFLADGSALDLSVCWQHRPLQLMHHVFSCGGCSGRGHLLRPGHGLQHHKRRAILDANIACSQRYKSILVDMRIGRLGLSGVRVLQSACSFVIADSSQALLVGGFNPSFGSGTLQITCTGAVSNPLGSCADICGLWSTDYW